MSSELSRKELKRPDVILVNLREGYHWVENNLKTLVWISAVIFWSHGHLDRNKPLSR